MFEFSEGGTFLLNTIERIVRLNRELGFRTVKYENKKRRQNRQEE